MPRSNLSVRSAAMILAILLAPLVYAQEAPRVVEMFPVNGDMDVNPSITQMRVTFDQDMGPGYSWVGSGSRFPKTSGEPYWLNSRTCAVAVALAADSDYELWINSDRFTKFASVSGTPAKWIHWQFRTGRARPVEEPPAPRVASLSPADGASDVIPGATELKVTFDRPMQMSVSFIGGGPKFPRVAGNPRWLDPQTVVLPVLLSAGHSYELGLSSASHMNFKSVEGGALAPVSWRFSTSGTAAATPEKEMKELNKLSWGQLKSAIDLHYSYKDLRRVDWDAKFEYYRARAGDARDEADFASVAATVLGFAGDMHIWLDVTGRQVPVTKRNVPHNWNDHVISRAFPGIKLLNKTFASGLSPDGIGYISISSMAVENAPDYDVFDEVMNDMKDTKSLIIDLRANGGGSEPLGRKVAGWFTTERLLYAKHIIRDPSQMSGWSDVGERWLDPSPDGKFYSRPVYVLSGRYVMSSAEAFVLMLAACPAVTVVGAPTYGSSGNPQAYALANGVVVYLPCWKAMLPDGTEFEGKGIQPDVLVDPRAEVFRTADPVLEKALELARSANNDSRWAVPADGAQPALKPSSASFFTRRARAPLSVILVL